ncbi:MAG: two-component system, OmpR family, alkaline phosphatase synthesis response regulator PhoP [Patescibacteria group bacterium]|nr:two-component system, OmpR family, alkaline phosphatase synthesis response regulator PhoP [Patescibacteria group bacterium]
MSEEKYVLIVEDDPFYSSIYKTKVEKEGLRSVLVHDGAAALQAIRKEKPAVVVLDLIMPGKDGFQVLEELKADPVFKDLVVLVLSNLSQDEDIKRVMDMGATEYLIKSNVPLQEVIAKVRSYIS